MGPLESRIKKADHPLLMFIITIDGPAGSGKTSLAGLIEAALESAGESVYTLHMDDLYDGWSNALSDELTQRLVAIIEQGESASQITIPRYDWHLGIFGEPITVDTPSTLIIEGVGSGQSATRAAARIKLWLDAPEEIALARAIERDGPELLEELLHWLVLEAEHFAKEQSESVADYRVKSAP